MSSQTEHGKKYIRALSRYAYDVIEMHPIIMHVDYCYVLN